MRHELQDLKYHIVEDGAISEQEVGLLQGLIARFGVGEDEARLLLDLNNILSGTQHPESFDVLFIESLTNYLVDDSDILLPDKWEWLQKSLLKDGKIDALEMRLLKAVNDRVRMAPKALRDAVAKAG